MCWCRCWRWCQMWTQKVNGQALRARLVWPRFLPCCLRASLLKLEPISKVRDTRGASRSPGLQVRSSSHWNPGFRHAPTQTHWLSNRVVLAAFRPTYDEPRSLSNLAAQRFSGGFKVNLTQASTFQGWHFPCYKSHQIDDAFSPLLSAVGPLR